MEEFKGAEALWKMIALALDLVARYSDQALGTILIVVVYVRVI